MAVPGIGEYVVYTSTRDALRMELSTGLLDDASSNHLNILVNVLESDIQFRQLYIELSVDHKIKKDKEHEILIILNMTRQPRGDCGYKRHIPGDDWVRWSHD